MPVLGALATSGLAASGAVGAASSLVSTTDTAQRVLPVSAGLAGLFPLGGLRRGGTVVVHGSTSLLLSLLAEATAGGSWAAVVGMPDLGVLAAAELGVAVHRLALVPAPGQSASGSAGVVAALLDGFDLVAVASGRLVESHARRLSARARHRGAVLLSFGPWPAADLELRCTHVRWHLDGKRLRQREVVVTARGRGAAARPRKAAVLLPAPDGRVEPASEAGVMPGNRWETRSSDWLAKQA